MPEALAFKVGDAVRLRVDGSPGMIVDAIEADGRLLCVWKDGAGNSKSQSFPSRSLRALETAPVRETGAP